jgi:hypothetical protein
MSATLIAQYLSTFFIKYFDSSFYFSRKSDFFVVGDPAGQFGPLDLVIRILRQKRKKVYYQLFTKHFSLSVSQPQLRSMSHIEPGKKMKNFRFGKMSQNVAHGGSVMLAEAHRGSMSGKKATFWVPLPCNVCKICMYI